MNTEPGLTVLRSLEEALADLRAKFEIDPSADMAKMIDVLEAESERRQQCEKP